MSDGSTRNQDRDADRPNDGDDMRARDGGAGSESAAGADDDADADDAKPRKPSVFKRPLFWIILVAVVVALVIGGTLYWLDARRYESTDDAFVDAHIVRIAPTVAGQLRMVADVDNRHVEAGRLLAVIEANGQEEQRAQAQADVAQAEAQYSQALAQIEAARSSRTQATAQARVPLAAATKAAQDLARYEALLRLDTTAVAGQQLDQARANARQTAADAAAARRQVDTADAQIAVARRGAAAAKTVIGAREAAVRQNDVTIGDLRLTAPVSGQVVNRQVNVGSYVAPGTNLMAIVPDRIWITANFKETQLGRMRPGMPVSITVDAYPDLEFKGVVDSIQRGAGQAFAVLPPQNATGNYVKVVQRVPVRIEFDLRRGPDPRRWAIGPGMSVIPTVKVR